MQAVAATAAKTRPAAPPNPLLQLLQLQQLLSAISQAIATVGWLAYAWLQFYYSRAAIIRRWSLGAHFVCAGWPLLASSGLLRMAESDQS